MITLYTNFLDHWKDEFTLPLTSPVLVFSIILLIILLSPLLLRKIRIPGIIGLIISGVIIGPHALHFLEKNSAVELFSTIGLLYIMFIAGLELELNDFIANRHKSIFFGLFTFIFPLAIGYPVCHYLLGLDTAASLLTASMFSTHTLVAYPIVSRLGITKNQAVAITVGGTILTDTAVLIVLAVVIGMHSDGLTNEFWIQLVTSLIIFSGIMFFIIPKIARWFFRNLESEKYSHYIFVLSVVFFAAFLAEVAGVEPIIGAFVAGLALNKLIPKSSALMNRIEFIGNSLFIPFFLISVGMIVDVSVIFNGWGALIIASVLTLVALFGKWVAAWITQIIFRYSSAQRKLIFGLSSSHAAATLAVILVGYKAGILNEDILNGTIILILITCIVASFVTEKAGKIIASEKMDDESETATFKYNEHILLAVNNFHETQKIVDLAALIKNPRSKQPLSLLTVFDNDQNSEKNILKARNEAEEIFSYAAATETKINFIPTIDHNPAGGIVRTSRETMADVIMTGWSRRTDIINRIIGETTDNIINHTNKTMFICQLNMPFEVHSRIVTVAPPLCEIEEGFRFWTEKIVHLSREISKPLVFYCNIKTAAEISKQIKKHDLQKTTVIKEFNDWQDFLILSRDIIKEDFLFIISARRRTASWMSILDNLPAKLEKYFEFNNKVIVYPQQKTDTHLNAQYKDIDSEALEIGIETVQRIGKGIGSIFRKENVRKEQRKNPPDNQDH
jgi:Kef-type K+ transport system membrane component KefB/nucleotide-binding universal stress UspA family protein